MGSASLVVFTQVVFLIATAAAGHSWWPYLKRNRRALIEEPVGLLVIALVLLAGSSAIATALYLVARLDDVYDIVDGSLRDGGWAYVIAFLRGAWPVAMLLAVIARWRLDNFDASVIATRLMTICAVTFVCSAMFLFMVW